MNNTILHINASAQNNASISRKMSQRLVDYFNTQNNAQVIERDLNNSIPHVDENWVGATFTPPENRTEQQIDKLLLSTHLVDELQQADIIIIGSPIYNFTIPASFKAWIDMVARVGLTFEYTETGPVGLLKNKKVIITLASGGTLIGSDYDFASNYLRHFFGFIGTSDVTFVNANDMAINNATDKTSSHQQISELLS